MLKDAHFWGCVCKDHKFSVTSGNERHCEIGGAKRADLEKSE
jgi:hypothetical protein